MDNAHATDVNMAADIANKKDSQLTTLKKQMMYMNLRQNEDSKYDASPPRRPSNIVDGFSSNTYTSDKLAIITVASLLVLAIIVRS